MKKFLTSILALAFVLVGAFSFVGCKSSSGKKFVYNDVEVTVIKSVYEGKIATTETMSLTSYIYTRLNITEGDTITPEMQEVVNDMREDLMGDFDKFEVTLYKDTGKAIICGRPCEFTGNYDQSIINFNYTKNKEGILDIGVICRDYDFQMISHISGKLDKKTLSVNVWDYYEDRYYSDDSVGDIVCRTIYFVLV